MPEGKMVSSPFFLSLTTITKVRPARMVVYEDVLLPLSVYSGQYSTAYYSSKCNNNWQVHWNRSVKPVILRSRVNFPGTFVARMPHRKKRCTGKYFSVISLSTRCTGSKRVCDMLEDMTLQRTLAEASIHFFKKEVMLLS